MEGSGGDKARAQRCCAPTKKLPERVCGIESGGEATVMKKRAFLKMAGVAGAGSVLSPMAVWGARSGVADKLKNWAGNVEYSTENLYAAKSVEAVKEYVRKQ